MTVFLSKRTFNFFCGLPLCMGTQFAATSLCQAGALQRLEFRFDESCGCHNIKTSWGGTDISKETAIISLREQVNQCKSCKQTSAPSLLHLEILTNLKNVKEDVDVIYLST
eukprot:3086257-Amphidinium_carterae.1